MPARLTFNPQVRFASSRRDVMSTGLPESIQAPFCATSMCTQVKSAAVRARVGVQGVTHVVHSSSSDLLRISILRAVSFCSFLSSFFPPVPPYCFFCLIRFWMLASLASRSCSKQELESSGGSPECFLLHVLHVRHLLLSGPPFLAPPAAPPAAAPPLPHFLFLGSVVDAWRV